MKPIDIILSSLLLYGAYKGYKKGLLVELIGTVALVVAIVGGFKLLDWMTGLIKPYFENAGAILPFIAFVILVVGIVYGLKMLGSWTRKTLKDTILGSFDGAGGAAFGIFKMAFLLSSVLWVIDIVGIKIPTKETKGTYIYPAVKKTGSYTVSVIAAMIPVFKSLAEEWTKTEAKAP